MPRKAATLSVADEDAASGGVAAVDRALSLLAVFSSTNHTLSLAELASATRLYGDQMETLWGEVLPVPASAIVPGSGTCVTVAVMFTK